MTYAPDDPPEDRQARYLRYLRSTGTVREACEEEGLNPQALYQWRRTNETFAHEEQLVRDDIEVSALDERADLLEEPQPNSMHLPFKAAIEYQRGASLADLGKKYGLNPSTIHKKFRRGGVVMRRRGPKSKGK